MSADIKIFDRDLLKIKQQRFTAKFKDYNFLHRHALKLVSERLEDITLTFENNLLIGRELPLDDIQNLIKSGTFEDLLFMDSLPHTSYQNSNLMGDEEFLPFGQEQMDLIICNLNLHQTNDLPGALIQIKKALKPDGLFIASLFGGETLWQLRESLAHAEQTIKGGNSPRIHPFADKQQMGALMQRAGFALPVVDSEFITVTYKNIYKLMSDLRGMGETNVVHNRQKTCSASALFQKAEEHYKNHHTDKSGQIEATFEMIFLIGWAPASTQQKPLRPGSAKNRLADFLNTDEISTGEKTGS